MSSPVESRTVEFKNGSGEVLVGNLLLCSDKLVILCHGYMSDRNWHLYPRMQDTLASVGLSSLRFDFSGNGQSEGTFQLASYMKEVEDLRAAVEYGRETLKVQVVAVVGHSKGGDVVLLYGAKYDDALVVNLAGRYDLRQGIHQRFGPDIFERLEREGRIAQPGRSTSGKNFVWWLTKEDLEMRMALDVPQAVTKIKHSKVHTVHGSQDQVIPVADAHSFDQAIANHTLHVIEGADHNFTSKAAGQQLLDVVKGILVSEGLASTATVEAG